MYHFVLKKVYDGNYEEEMYVSNKYISFKECYKSALSRFRNMREYAINYTHVIEFYKHDYKWHAERYVGIMQLNKLGDIWLCHKGTAINL